MNDPTRPDSGTQPSGDPSQTWQQHRPNWGSAYPPPQQPHQPAPGFPPPGGYPYPGFGTPPKHSNASTAMVLGIVSVVGGFLCGLPLLIAPFAWFMGSKTMREIEASHGTQSGEGEALAGKVLGIIGTVLLGLCIAGIIVLVVLSFTIDGFWDDEGDDYYNSAVRFLLQRIAG